MMKLAPPDLRLGLAALFVSLLCLLLAWRLHVTADQLTTHTVALSQAMADLATVRADVAAVPGLRADLKALAQRVEACPCKAPGAQGGDDQ
ncbi:MAG: hypothetical protein VKM17_00190 [Cyanobacteriota bacterium]|nr:hypothetical protein [Cyanobacteriota bacterium]